MLVEITVRIARPSVVDVCAWSGLTHARACYFCWVFSFLRHMLESLYKACARNSSNVKMRNQLRCNHSINGSNAWVIVSHGFDHRSPFRSRFFYFPILVWCCCESFERVKMIRVSCCFKCTSNNSTCEVADFQDFIAPVRKAKSVLRQRLRCASPSCSNFVCQTFLFNSF